MSSPLTNLGLFGNFGVCDKDIIAGLNANFELLDNLVQLTFDDFVDELPESPDEGDKYILSTDGSINMWDGSKWLTYPAQDGYIAYNKDDESLYIYDGSSWNLFSVDVDISSKMDRYGLNFLDNGSFEQPNATNGWSILNGSISQAATTLLTKENKLSLHVNAGPSDTLNYIKLIPSDTDGMEFVFSGWIGPRSEDVQIDIFSGIENASVTVEASNKWEKFSLYITAQAQIDLEFRNTLAVNYQIDELYLGPATSGLLPNVTVVLDGNAASENDRKIALQAAYPVQFKSLYDRYGDLTTGNKRFKVFGSYFDTVDEIRHDYAWNGTEFVPLEDRRVSYELDVSTQVISGMHKTSYREFDDDTPLALVDLKEGFTTIVAIKNVGLSTIEITLPVGSQCRADMNLEIEVAKTSVFTFVNIGGVVYVACIDNMEPA